MPDREVAAAAADSEHVDGLHRDHDRDPPRTTQLLTPCLASRVPRCLAVEEMILETMSDRVASTSAVDAQIADLTRQIHSLKMTRNSMASISFLPDELIFRIILEYALAMDIYSTKWGRILFVCRRWHNIAVHHAQLWSFFSSGIINRPEWRERSGTHPLSLKFEYPRSDGLEAFISLHDHASRVRSIKMILSTKGFRETFYVLQDEETGFRLPMLECLHLRVCGERTEKAILPPFILKDGLPLLRSVRLTDVDFMGLWHLLSNLTDLELGQLEYPLPVPSLDELFAVLQRSPHLRRLKLDNYLPSDPFSLEKFRHDYGHGFPSSRLALPELEHLELGAPVASLNALLRSLDLPSSTSINLSAKGWYDHTEVSILLVPVRLHLRKSGAPILRSLAIESRALFIKCYTTPTCEAFFLDHEAAHFTFRSYNTRQRAIRTMASRVLDALPLSDLEHLNLLTICDDEITRCTWRTVFRHVPHLESILIGVNDGLMLVLESLLDAIRADARGLSGKKRRRASQGLSPSHWPSRLRLIASHDGKLHGPVETEQVALYVALERLLADYKAIDTPSKPGDVAWQMIEIDLLDRGFDMAYTYADRLFAVVQRLSLEGQNWERLGESPSDISSHSDSDVAEGPSAPQ
ncbi:hypothetical protein BV25DRAFT_843603 [Artomyces pyxidatus]|uniref:Uncharacterized protein n=1 Tax=Artomyces pyxidatus TaxID=48021 RepID=A0ACB8TGW2_9AGAM|nr:hypothetical protein BV25DRAFT_843603 [Artomyces pyxidatus]